MSDIAARNEIIRTLAKDEHQEDGRCEIDDDAKVSEDKDNGAYVQAWVWVSFGETELDKNG